MICIVLIIISKKKRLLCRQWEKNIENEIRNFCKYLIYNYYEAEQEFIKTIRIFVKAINLYAHKQIPNSILLIQQFPELIIWNSNCEAWFKYCGTFPNIEQWTSWQVFTVKHILCNYNDWNGH